MEWKWSKANEKSLARFVSDRAVELLPKLSASPFELIQTREGRLNLVRSIYDRLLNQGIQYAYEKYHPEEEIQRLRTPAEVLYAPGEGTCLDLALLFCGLCFGYELLPLLVVIEGHAFAAVSLNHQRREWNGFARERNLFNSTELFRGEESGRALQKLIEDEAYVAVECTGFARTRSFTGSMPEAVGRSPQGTMTFDRAVAAGREQLANSGRGFLFAIDIAVAQYVWKIEPAALSAQSEESSQPASPDSASSQTTTFGSITFGNLSGNSIGNLAGGSLNYQEAPKQIRKQIQIDLGDVSEQEPFDSE